MSSARLKDFNAIINKFHSTLEVIRDEVTQTIESRDPAVLLPIYSSSSNQVTSQKLCQAMKDIGRLSDKLSSFAMEPSEYLALIAGSFYESIALRIVSQLGVADAMNEGQMTLTELASKVNADEGRLCNVMRALIHRGVFYETHYGSKVFGNNRASSILLSVHEKNMNGFVSNWADDGYRAADSGVKGLRPENKDKSFFEIHQGISLYEYFKTPEGAQSREWGNRNMVAAESILRNGLIYDYDWTKHGDSVTIVDVGSGIGGSAIELTRRFPRIKMILQDTPAVMESAVKFWEQNSPECKPRITFMPHDFFTPQPSWSHLPSKPELYFIRLTLHNWSDDKCVIILSHIRNSILPAEKGGRLYIAECIMDEDADRFKSMASLHIMTLTGTLQRTEGNFRELLRRSGFKLEAIHCNSLGFLGLIEAVAC